MTGGLYCLAAAALLPSSALRPLSPLILLASTPSGEREGAGQQQSAAHAAQRNLPVRAIEIKQATGLALLEFGHPFHQHHPILKFGVLVHDFDISSVHRCPADGVGVPWILMRETDVQLHQMVLSHFEELELDS